MNNKTKIFGLGLLKTGTTTLGHCFKALGFNHYDTPWPLRMKMYEESLHNDFSTIRKAIEAFDSFEDIPWPYVYKMIDREYPKSKFILTVRKDAETWLDSMKYHSLCAAPDLRHSRKLLFGYPYPHKHEAYFIDYYERHIQEVCTYFTKRDNFLEVCWEREDGWDKLCRFLGKSAPTTQFPHLNRRPSRVKIKWYYTNKLLALLSSCKLGESAFLR